MTMFYVLPSQERFELAWAQFLQLWFPGATWEQDDLRKLWEIVTGPQSMRSGIEIVFRDSLPGLGSLSEDLATGFGASTGEQYLVLGSDGGCCEQGEILSRLRKKATGFERG